MHQPVLIFISIFLSMLFMSCSGGEKLDLKAVNADLNNGRLVYEYDCMLCHEGAIEGAHRLDQNDRWKESADKGFEKLVSNTVQGYRGKYGELPVMGMCSQCSEQDIRDAVAYMLIAAGFME